MTSDDYKRLADQIEASDGLFTMHDDKPRQLGIRQSAEVIAALRAASVKAGEVVAVRPLEWTDEPDRPWNCPAWNAVSVTGQSFRVFKAWWGAKDKWGYVYGDFHHTEAEAKAAAQADYEQRILSALVIGGRDDLR